MVLDDGGELLRVDGIPKSVNALTLPSPAPWTRMTPVTILFSMATSRCR